jgi:hypothetical protein
VRLIADRMNKDAVEMQVSKLISGMHAMTAWYDHITAKHILMVL